MILLQEITLKYCKIQIFDTKLIRLEVLGNRIIGAAEAREMNDAIGVLSRGQECLVMAVANEVNQFTKEAVDFSSSSLGLKYSIAWAVVVRSLTQRITANIYLRLNKPLKPFKIFNTEREASRWLYSLEEELVEAW